MPAFGIPAFLYLPYRKKIKDLLNSTNTLKDGNDIELEELFSLN
jgi:hypothetical protein